MKDALILGAKLGMVNGFIFVVVGFIAMKLDIPAGISGAACFILCAAYSLRSIRVDKAADMD